jgi:hypothetical protein
MKVVLADSPVKEKREGIMKVKEINYLVSLLENEWNNFKEISNSWYSFLADFEKAVDELPSSPNFSELEKMGNKVIKLLQKYDSKLNLLTLWNDPSFFHVRSAKAPNSSSSEVERIKQLHNRIRQLAGEAKQKATKQPKDNSSKADKDGK